MGALLVHGEGGSGVEVLLAEVAVDFAADVVVGGEDVLPASVHRLESLVAVDADEHRHALLVEFARTVGVAADVIDDAIVVDERLRRRLLPSFAASTSTAAEIDDESGAVFLFVVAIRKRRQIKSGRRFSRCFFFRFVSRRRNFSLDRRRQQHRRYRRRR